MPQGKPVMRDAKGRLIPGSVDYRGGGGSSGDRGSGTGEAADKAAADRAAEKAERDRFRATSGAGGLGGAAKASKPEFQKRERAHMARWRAARGKKKGQKAAARKIGAKKETDE